MCGTDTSYQWLEVFEHFRSQQILDRNRKRYWTFVDLEKAFDRVPREVSETKGN